VTKIIVGNRVGRLGRIALGCSASLFDTSGRILLTRRKDNNLWCLPGGHLTPGENVIEACIREVKEETGLTIEVERLLGIYSSPNYLVQYPDGNLFQSVAINFLASILSGEWKLSKEVSEIKFFQKNELRTIELMELHKIRVDDSFSDQKGIFIR
jgi:ADP-ribose pyrophosphatase YjhB (NUDIX family)